MGAEAGHSKLGASKAARWLACPGSVALADTLPEPRESKYAREGSAAHYVAETCLENGYDAEALVGKILHPYPDVECTAEMAAAVQVYLDFCRSLVKPGSRKFIENRFALADFDSELYGKNDFSCFDPENGTINVVDYKHGAGVTVAVEGNAQLRYYALGAMYAIGAGVTEVRIHVVQPRAYGEAVKTAVYEPIDLIDFGGELAAGAAETRKPGAKLCPGDHCRFCPGKEFAACPALRDTAEAFLLGDFDHATAAETVRELPADDLGRLLADAAAAKQWIAAVEAHAYREAIAGKPVAGFKLVQTKGKRDWKDGALTMRQAGRVYDWLSEDILYKKTPLSPAQLEKLLGKSKSTTEFLDGYLAEPKKGFALAPLSDRRPEVAPPTGSDFDHVDNGETENE